MDNQQFNNYPNPLDNFRSYSYHFVMTAASTTEAFRHLIVDNGRPMLSAIQSKSLGDEFELGGQKSYLVVDTRRFSQYSITSLEMEHIYGSGNPTNPSVPVNTTSIKLIDTTGLSFFNFMMDLFRNKLKTTRASAFFLVSIIFVGHRDDGTTETISTCHIPMILLTMGFSLNEKGSEFDIQMMEVEGAPQRGHQQMANLGMIKSVCTKKDGNNTIGEMIDDLEEQLNIQSLEFYQKFSNADTESKAPLKLGKLVQYMITVPNTEKYNWYQMKISNARQNGVTELEHRKDGTRLQTSTAPKSSYSQLSFSYGMSIPDAIKAILESSNQFIDLASEQKAKAGEMKAFKTITSITCDESTYLIHFDVYPYHVPNVDKKANEVTPGNKNIVGEKSLVRNLIYYDYIFSGMNSHIKDLKIQYDPTSAVALDTDVNIGTSRQADISAQGQKTVKVTQQTTAKTEAKEVSYPQIRAGDPIFIPIVSKDQFNSNTAFRSSEMYSTQEAVKNFKKKQEYSKNYSSLHFLSSISVDMTVRGNPNIIRKFADRDERGGAAPHDTIISVQALNALETQGQDSAKNNFTNSIKNRLTSAKQKYINEYVVPKISQFDKKAETNEDGLMNKVDISTLPVFIKLNIRAPKTDWTGDFSDAKNMYTDEFFYNGPYMLLVLKTTFSNGDFEHNMSLMPYVVSDKFTNDKDNDADSAKPPKKQQ